MEQCQCEQYEILAGQEAEHYRTKWLKRVADVQGWRQLWRCQDCKSYWEMTWEGGGGFDDGQMVLQRLSPSELAASWPEIEQE